MVPTGITFAINFDFCIHFVFLLLFLYESYIFGHATDHLRLPGSLRCIGICSHSHDI